MAIADDLVASLDGHQVTDDEGNIADEPTSDQTSTADEPNTEEETEEVKTTDESKDEVSQPKSDEEESGLAVDESGRKYVPEKRFKDVYKKWKDSERANTFAATQAIKPELDAPQTAVGNMPADKMARMENEFLFTRYPQFDPSSSNYSKALDNVAVDVYTASQGRMTKLEAARAAISRAKELSESEDGVKGGVRQVKLAQSGSGISGRGGVRDTSVNPDDMSLQDMEAYVKNAGKW